MFLSSFENKEVDPDPETSENSAADLRQWAKATRRVLIIDDDRQTAEAIKYIVESYGSSLCEVIEDAYEGSLALSDRPYDFVFVDQRLPGMFGDEVLSQVDENVDSDPLIAESGRFAISVPVVIMSGNPIKLNPEYKLHNFNLVEVLVKKDLPRFLSLYFAN